MRLMISLATAVLFTSLGCDIVVNGNGPLTVGSGVAKQETREVPAFTGVDITSSFEATVTIGPKPSVTLDMDDNLLEFVKTDVREGCLHVEYASGHNIRTSKPQKVTIVVLTLDAVKAQGAAKVVATASEGKTFKIVAEGASVIELKELATDSFDLKAGGASQVTVLGRAKHLTLNESGASKVKAGKVAIESASVSLDGASSGELSVSGSIEGQLSGASSLKVLGDPKTRAVKTSGASSVSY